MMRPWRLRSASAVCRPGRSRARADARRWRSPAARAGDDTGGVDADNASDGYTPAEGSASPPAFHVNGYVDIGFAHAGGDGTSFPAGDTRLPADYGVDTFAPAVNSRGDVASTDAGGAS